MYDDRLLEQQLFVHGHHHINKAKVNTCLNDFIKIRRRIIQEL
jgi:hypothetical protein